jgi:hypothetical protein
MLMKNSHVTRWIMVMFALAAGAGYSAAQGKPAEPARPASGNGHEPGMGMHSCPMEGVGPLADIHVENTADGAVIQLKAKSPGDVQRIQEMAAKMAEHMSAGGMKGMHGGMKGMHGGGMEHDGMQGGTPGAATQDAHHPKEPKTDAKPAPKAAPKAAPNAATPHAH